AADGSFATMPQQRTSTAATVAVAAANMAPNLLATIFSAQVQEHEGGLGAWQAEWATFPVLALITSGAVHSVAEIAQSLEVDGERMRANLDQTRGLLMLEPIA